MAIRSLVENKRGGAGSEFISMERRNFPGGCQFLLAGGAKMNDRTG
jgi:hypothetical protein